LRSVLDWLGYTDSSTTIGRIIMAAIQGYCMKCKTKREMKDPKAITMKNGKKAQSGTCEVCGTKMFKIGG